MKKILIVEDDFFIRDIYQKTFVSEGYDVDTALDGEEGLQKAKQNNYDLILLDIMLPKITGIDVLKSLRQKGEKTEETPIFMITNLGLESILDAALRLGADGYFIKAQLDPRDVVSEINNYLLRIKHPKS